MGKLPLVEAFTQEQAFRQHSGAEHLSGDCRRTRFWRLRSSRHCHLSKSLWRGSRDLSSFKFLPRHLHFNEMVSFFFLFSLGRSCLPGVFTAAGPDGRLARNSDHVGHHPAEFCFRQLPVLLDSFCIKGKKFAREWQWLCCFSTAYISHTSSVLKVEL